MRTIHCSLLMAAFAFTHVARAAETPATPKPVPAKAAVKQATIEELGAMLENMGHEPKAVKNDKGETTGWDTQYKAEGRTIYGRIEVSPNGRFIWLTGVIATLKDGETVPDAMFANLLGLNPAIGPSYVQWEAKTKTFLVALAVSNVNFSPADLRNSLDIFAGGIKQTMDVWTSTRNAATQPAVAVSPAP